MCVFNLDVQRCDVKRNLHLVDTQLSSVQRSTMIP